MNMALAPVRSSTPRTNRIEARAGGLLGDCRRAFHCFAELDELAENLRILSLNAELAAGRAGDKGRAVRALTQYTRELVNRLAQIQAEMDALRGRTFAFSSTILLGLQHMSMFERAVDLVGGSGPGARVAERAFAASTERMVDTLDGMAAAVTELSRRAHAIEEVVSQSDSIATNIAIEAAAAGVHEKEFRTVADTMRRYVDELRLMIEEASDAVRRAADRGEALRRLGLDCLDELKGFG